MSHFLKRIRIKNYRSIVELELQLNAFSPLVGENNVGKSNILNAIQWFVKPDKLEKAHFNNISAAIEVEGEIDCISEDLLDDLDANHANRLRPFVSQGAITLKRSMERPGAASTARLEILNPESQKFEVNPTGIAAAISALFPDPVRVEAMVDALEDAAKNKTTTTLGKLLSKLSTPVEEGQGARLSELFGEVGKLLSAEGSNRAEELKEFDRDATLAIQDYFPGISISVHFPEPSLPELFKSGTVRVKEDNAEEIREFAELGHGAQRSIQMAMVQLLAAKARKDNDSPRCTLLLIDEPELYLHPQAIEQVRSSLKKLSSAGYQVIFSTHSPRLIDRTDLPEANIVSKPDLRNGTNVNKRVSELVRDIIVGDAAKQAHLLFELGNASEILFCRKVLLVEGHTEPEVIPSLYSSIRGCSLRADKTGVVRLTGSGNIEKALQVLRAMGVNVCALVDLDFAFKQAVRSGLIEEDNPHRLMVKQWFLDYGNTHGITVCDEGFPTKKSDGGAEGAYQKMAKDNANIPCVQALHEQLKSKGVWLWRKGSIEQVMGIDHKNDPAEMTGKCRELESIGIAALAEPDECRAFCEWLATFDR